MMFSKRELINSTAEEASRTCEGERMWVKLSGKRTGERTTF